MKVTDTGEDPEIAVVACLHGDEKCGRHAVNRLLDEEELERPVRFVLANEKAMKKGERFVDVDLNRCFPGDSGSERHEERLAAELMKELKGRKTLVIHAMENFEEAFGLVNGVDPDLVRAPGTDKAVDVAPLEEDSIERYLDAVSVEAGEKGTEQAKENAYRILRNFLSYFDALNGEKPGVRPELFEMYEAVPGNYRFLAENFTLVEEDEIYAENEEEELRADEAFYPVLMSSDGYDEILGFKGRRPEEGLKGREVNR